MKRTALLVTSTLSLGLALAAGPAVAANAAPATAAAAAAADTTETCSHTALQSGLATTVCVDVTGTDVALSGQIALAGPPSISGPGQQPQPPQLITTLSGTVVGGADLGTTQQDLIFRNQTLHVTGVSGTVNCGDTVHASFTVASFGWGNTPVTVDVPVTC
ncbi:hypothetical protein OG455_31300 [Kitasatospora sp. NBC_01287]|uniref:hypothetical protein n=1 Tax=Kitasatospora sp. NBC_01287 TaxID=2903573 RepID=UPI00224E81AB|nr:hypothetical protein [Kitasatospora sp. NBC_01287]MCX4749953.1 hypothetical protein [Kitasatospora sp. NBC_01287]